MGAPVRRPRRTIPLVAEPVEVVAEREAESEVIDLRHDEPSVIDLREPREMSWEESASLVEFPTDLGAQIADRRRETPAPGTLRAGANDAPPTLPRHHAASAPP